MNVIEANFGKRRETQEKLKVAEAKFLKLFIEVFIRDLSGDDEKVMESLITTEPLSSFLAATFFNNNVPENVAEFKELSEGLDMAGILAQRIAQLSTGPEELSFLETLEEVNAILEKAHQGLT